MYIGQCSLWCRDVNLQLYQRLQAILNIYHFAQRKLKFVLSLLAMILVFSVLIIAKHVFLIQQYGVYISTYLSV